MSAGRSLHSAPLPFWPCAKLRTSAWCLIFARELSAATDDTARSEVLSRICSNFIHSDPDSARWYGTRALALVHRIGHPKALGDAHNNLGWLDAQYGRSDSAEAQLNKALAQFQRIGNPAWIAVTLSNLGLLANKRGDQVGAVKNFQASLKQSELVNDTAGMALAFYSIGSTYRKMKEFDRGMEYLHRSLAMERALGRKTKEANCPRSIANVYAELGDRLPAMKGYEEAYGIFVEHHDDIGAGIVQENIGDLLSDTSPKEALIHYQLAFAQYDSARSDLDKASVLRRLGRAHITLGDLKEAKADVESDRVLAVPSRAQELVMDYELAMAELARAEGDGKVTFAHYERYVVMKDSHQGAETQTELARLRTEFETERKERTMRCCAPRMTKGA